MQQSTDAERQPLQLPPWLQAKISSVIETSSTNSTANEPSPYSCDKCQDTGFVTFTRDGYTFSQVCECQKVKRARERMERSGLKETVHSYLLSNFSTESPWQQDMKTRCADYLQDLRRLYTQNPDNERFPWLFVGGNPGSGKTHLCTAVCGQMLAFGKSVIYMQWIQDARRLKSCLVEPDLFDSMAKAYETCDLLYIDDLFKSVRPSTSSMLQRPEPSDADLRCAFEILNARYIRNLPTIISAEWFLEDELIPLDEGTFSRVYQRTSGRKYVISIPRTAEHNYRLSQARKGGMPHA